MKVGTIHKYSPWETAHIGQTQKQQFSRHKGALWNVMKGRFHFVEVTEIGDERGFRNP
jgi:hypothetical protein